MMIEKRPENAVVKVGPKKGINWPAVYQYLLDYCNDTTIHGFKVNRFSFNKIEFFLLFHRNPKKRALFTIIEQEIQPSNKLALPFF